jgi:hypothetical protein
MSELIASSSSTFGSDGVRISDRMLSACNGDEGTTPAMLQSEMYHTMQRCGYSEKDRRLMVGIISGIDAKDCDLVAVMGVYSYLIFLQNKVAVFFAKTFFSEKETTVQNVKDANKGPGPLCKRLVCLLLTNLDEKAKEIYIRGPPIATDSREKGTEIYDQQKKIYDEEAKIYANAKPAVNDSFNNILVTSNAVAVHLREVYGTLEGDADKFLTQYRETLKAKAKEARLHKPALTVGSSAPKLLQSTSKPEGTEDSLAKRFETDHLLEETPMPSIKHREPPVVPSPTNTPEIKSAPQSINPKKSVGSTEKPLEKIVASSAPERTARLSSASSSPVKTFSITPSAKKPPTQPASKDSPKNNKNSTEEGGTTTTKKTALVKTSAVTPQTTKAKSPSKTGRVKEVNPFTLSSVESAEELPSSEASLAEDDEEVDFVSSALVATLKRSASQSVDPTSNPEGTEDSSPVKRSRKDHLPKEPPSITSPAMEKAPVAIRKPVSSAPAATVKKPVFTDAAKVAIIDLSKDDKEVQIIKIKQHIAVSQYNMDVKQVGNEIYIVDNSSKKGFRARDCVIKIEFPGEYIEID